jgi:hypothetical protein
MIFSSDIHPRFWAEASHTAIHILNRTLTQTLFGVTPFEVWTGRKPSLAHVQVWKCDAYVHIPKGNRSKLQPKSEKGIFMGYSNQSKAYRVWIQSKQKFTESRDVAFNESSVSSKELPSVQDSSVYFYEGRVSIVEDKGTSTQVNIAPDSLDAAPPGDDGPAPDSTEATTIGMTEEQDGELEPHTTVAGTTSESTDLVPTSQVEVKPR